MTREFTLNVDDIIRELNLGRATVNFMLERFGRLLPHDRIQGRPCYRPDALSTLIRIKDLMDQGLMPSQVESSLETSSPSTTDSPPVEDVRMSRDALAFIQNLFQDIKVHQNRIAQAHEKRAEAEERKAVAIEKRAEAEAKKAEAMNNIATALQEMSRHRPVDTQTLEIAGQAAHALTLNETHDLELESEAEDMTIDLGAGLDDTDLDHIFSPPGSDNELRDEPDHIAPEDLDLDDLTIEMPDGRPQDLDDLAQLVDRVSTQGDSGDDPAEIDPTGDDLAVEELTEEDLEELLDAPPLPDLNGLDQLVEREPDEALAPEDEPILLEDLDLLDNLELLLDEEPAAEGQDLDDLSLLVETAAGTSEHPDPSAGLDDLSLLVDPPVSETPPALDLDDLSALVGDAQDQTLEDLDNLYDLVGTPTTEPPAAAEDDLDNLFLLVEDSSLPPKTHDMDNLYDLVDGPAGPPADLDDLSLLVDTGEAAGEQHREMDDLSALISESDDAPAVEPSLKPDITPDQDMAKYKAAVMKIIIDLKNQGLSPGDTTERLNRDEVLTLSGKPLWREKAIAKIYGFIDSAT